MCIYRIAAQRQNASPQKAVSRSVAPEGLDGVEVGRLDRREKAEHDADDHGEHHGDEDRRNADSRRRTHDGRNEPRHDDADDHAEHTAEACEHRRFREELVEDAAASAL